MPWTSDFYPKVERAFISIQGVGQVALREADGGKIGLAGGNIRMRFVELPLEDR